MAYPMKKHVAKSAKRTQIRNKNAPKGDFMENTVLDARAEKIQNYVKNGGNALVVIGASTAVVAVGASLPNLQALDKNKYRLIPIGDQIVERVKGIYTTMTVNYSGLSEGPVHTLASKLAILTRKYNTASKVQAQRHFRDCLSHNLTKLQDDGSPSWQNVQANDRGVLDWYEIPATK